MRYVERNPVRAGLVQRAWEWPWSSAAAHVGGRGDGLIGPGGPLTSEVSDWRRFLSEEDDEKTVVRLRRHTRTGRALGSVAFVERMEGLLGLTLRPQKPGPRPRKTKTGS